MEALWQEVHLPSPQPLSRRERGLKWPSLLKVEVSHASIFKWVKIFGNKAISKLEEQLKRLSEDKEPDIVQINEKVKKIAGYNGFGGEG